MLIEIVLIERKKQASNKLIEIETHHNPKALHSQKNQNDDKRDDSFIFSHWKSINIERKLHQNKRVTSFAIRKHRSPKKPIVTTRTLSISIIN